MKLNIAIRNLFKNPFVTTVAVMQGVTVLAATTVRVDMALEVGAASEEVTVSADAPLLRTESGDLSHNIRTDSVDALPVLSIGAAAGISGIRNPTAVAQLLPGAYVVPNTTVKINGAPGNTASYRLEGQDTSNGQVPATQAQVQPSVDALQEVGQGAAEYPRRVYEHLQPLAIARDDVVIQDDECESNADRNRRDRQSCHTRSGCIRTR